MLMVKEYYDGNFNATPCKDITSARFLMGKYIESLKDFEYETIDNTDNYFEAEIAGNLYSIEIVDTQIFDVDQVDDSHDDIIASITWTREDLEEFLKSKGYGPIDENIKTLLDNRLTKTLEERSIEEGWEIIDTIFCMCEDKLK